MGNIILPLWADSPAATRIVVAGLPVFSVVLMLLDAAAEPASWLTAVLFHCDLESVLQRFRVWTLFIGPLYTPISGGMAFLMTLFVIYMGMQMFPHRERELGSMVFIAWTLVVNALINVMYLCVMFCFAMWHKGTLGEMMYYRSSWSGLWPLLIVAMTLRMMGDPNGSTSFWGMVQIPNKWYPACIVAFFCLLNRMTILWQLVGALAIGYGEPWLKLDQRMLVLRHCLLRVERRCCGRCVQNGVFGASWVSMPNAQAAASWAASGSDSRYDDISDFGRSGGASQSGGGGGGGGAGGGGGSFVAFAGSGNRLGHGDGGSTQPFVEMREAPEEAPAAQTQQHAAPAPLPTVSDGV